MNKKIIIPAGIVIAIIAIAIATLSGGGNKVTLEWEKAKAPSVPGSVELHVFVENSGSMDGYMCSGSQLKDAVFDYVSDLKTKCKNTSLAYINSEIIPCPGSLENYIQNLTPASFAKAGGNRANTDLRKIFELILQKHKENTITVFVSDCILDVPEDARDFFVNCQVSIKNSFNGALARDPSLGVEIMKMQSKFNGTWYCGKSKETLTNVKRPYYIWVIGNKYLLAKINKEVPYNGIVGGVESYCAFSKPSALPFNIDPKRYVVNHTKKIEVDVLADLTHSLQEERTLTSPSSFTASKQVKVVSSRPIKAANSRYSHAIKLEIDNPQSLNSVQVTLKSAVLPSWVKACNDDTGTNVRQNLNKTTGIYYLINGVAEAYKTSAPFGEITFKIKK